MVGGREGGGREERNREDMTMYRKPQEFMETVILEVDMELETILEGGRE